MFEENAVVQAAYDRVASEPPPASGFVARTVIPYDVELIEARIKAGQLTMREGLIAAYKAGKARPRELSQAQEALLRTVAEMSADIDGNAVGVNALSELWGLRRRIPRGFVARVASRSLAVLVRLELVQLTSTGVRLTAVGQFRLAQ